jgi:hypothetical protein
MELLGDVGHMESCFGLVEDGVSVRAREVHGLLKCTTWSEIILDPPDGTPW